MKFFTLSVLFCAILAAIGCGDKNKHAAETSPTLLPEKPVENNDPLPLPKTGEGHFENMVADYESQDRVIWQKPELVIAMLGNLNGKTVADIGAGTGFFAFRMVPMVQKVIAIDIDYRFIKFMDSVKVRLPLKMQPRFESRLAPPDNPHLAPAEADAAIIVNTYCYIENRVDYLSKLSEGLKNDGQLLIIDFKKNNLPVGPSDEFKVASQQVEKELAAAGFQVVKSDKTTLDYQYIILAKKLAR